MESTRCALKSIWNIYIHIDMQTNIYIYIYTYLEYYSAEKIEFLFFATKWMHLEMMLSEVNQSKNVSSNMCQLIQNTKE